MRSFGKWLGRILLSLTVLVGLVWAFGPREQVDDAIAFDPATIGADIDAYLAKAEAAIPDLDPDVAKRVIWAGEAGDKTPVSVVFIHGFSATSQEVRPLPDLVARDLGANLVMTRLAGHGRDGDAMAEPDANDWLTDTAEALAIARRIGDRVLVISSSTGSTLVAVALTHPDLAESVAGTVFLSPNFRVQNPMAVLLTMPAARWWAPVLAGRTREWQPANPEQGKYWSTRYPTVATIPMGALVDHANRLDYSGVTVPALFLFSDRDTVIDHARTREIAERWGAPATVEPLDVPDGNDPSFHVLAGDILSPGMTEEVRKRITNWFGQL